MHITILMRQVIYNRSPLSVRATNARTFADLLKRLPLQKQTQLITFLGDVEAHHSYPEYQAVIDSLKRTGEDKLAGRFEEARAKREKQSDH